MTFDSATLQPLIDAMVRAGADRNSIQLPIGFAGPAFRSKVATVSGDVPNPTTEQMQSGIQTVGAAIAAVPNATLQSVEITLHAEHCENMQTQARDTALSFARTKAASVAKALGVRLGSVLSVTAVDSMLQSGTCSSSYTVTPYGSDPPQPSDYLKITVTSNVSITYAIR